MAKVTYIVQSTTGASRFIDVMGVTQAPTTTQLLRAYTSLAGACANFNSNGVANVKANLYRGDDNEAPEVTSHPFDMVMKKPNPYMGFKQMIKMIQTYLEMTGKAYLKIVPGVMSPVVELYPLQSHLVSPELDTNNQIVRWKYDKTYLTLDEVVPFYFVDPLNPYGNGKGPAELAWAEIVLMSSDTAMMTALMKNGGAPSYVMSPKDQQGVVSKTILDRLMAVWRSFRGKGAGNLMIPEIPVEIQTLAQTSKDFEGSARFRDLKSVILNCFSIPGALFDSAGTRAELDSAQVQWTRFCLDPRTSLLEDVFNRRILSLFGDDVKMFFENALSEDEATGQDAEGLPTQPNPSGSTVMNQETDDAEAA